MSIVKFMENDRLDIKDTTKERVKKIAYSGQANTNQNDVKKKRANKTW